jgi:hypothetical protein
MRCRDGAIVEVSEWKSQAAIDAAHKIPTCSRSGTMFAVCECVPLKTLPEARQMFAGFRQSKNKSDCGRLTPHRTFDRRLLFLRTAETPINAFSDNGIAPSWPAPFFLPRSCFFLGQRHLNVTRQKNGHIGLGLAFQPIENHTSIQKPGCVCDRSDRPRIARGISPAWDTFLRLLKEPNFPQTSTPKQHKLNHL